MDELSGRTALLLINYRSRQGKADLRPALEPLHQRNVEVIEVGADQPAQAIAEHRDGIDLIIVGGGDGTLNGIVEAVIDSGLPFGLLPLGTANDLARTLGIPTDLAAAAGIIAEGRTRRIDVGCVNGKHFFNVASLGLSTQVARELTGATKRRWGVLGYPLSLWRALRKMRSFRAEIRCDDARERVRSIQISVGNGRYYGGGMTIATDAVIDDGKLDLVSLAPHGFWRLVLSSPALRWGVHDNIERVRHWRGREIEIRTRRPMPINTDGEVTTRTPARIRVVPKAVSVYVPWTTRSKRGEDDA